eukprot:TRINITY_DN5255_c0_g2_i1.p1 TRINITY_DN5255_c0_g2~~TRINITY_DN5255_c0_g2_i1.p1  ORF type:complete len:386 (-),score=81.57 TRINITY_DN5255_c0_g2_i1:1023-2180(-)
MEDVNHSSIPQPSNVSCLFCKEWKTEANEGVVHSIANFEQIDKERVESIKKSLAEKDLTYTFKSVADRFPSFKSTEQPSTTEEDFILEIRSRRYKLLELLSSKGYYSNVFLADTEDQNSQAVFKFYKSHGKEEDIFNRFHLELFVLQQLDHPNIIKLLSHGITKDFCPFLVVTYGGVTLESLFPALPTEGGDQQAEQQSGKRRKLNPESTELADQPAQPVATITLDNRVPWLMLQLLEAIEYAHTKLGISHNDLKLNNILYDSAADKLVVADWNSADVAFTTELGKKNCVIGRRVNNFESNSVQDLRTIGKICLRLLHRYPRGNMDERQIQSMLRRTDAAEWRDVIKILLGYQDARQTYPKAKNILAKLAQESSAPPKTERSAAD